MNRAFLDTSYLLALVLRRDEHHEAARGLQASYAGSLITTEYVLVELHDALCQVALRGLALAMADALVRDAGVEIVRASEQWFARGRQLYRERSDKDWSLTDCISFVVMQEHGVRDALTADHHFAQAGFEVLLK